MASHTIKAVQQIPASTEQVWDFFSDHANLQRITPANLQFKVISQHHRGTIYPGEIIEYRLKPFLGITVYWMTEITHVVPGKFFVDEQRKGPYALWHHQHHFSSIDGGTEMVDIVHYKNPFGFIGNMANSFFVRKKVEAIFDYRFKQIEEIFGKWR